jgi:hypothetical protein
MKHSLKIILILVMLFLVTQYFGLFIIDSYSTETIQNINGENITSTTRNLFNRIINFNIFDHVFNFINY